MPANTAPSGDISLHRRISQLDRALTSRWPRHNHSSSSLVPAGVTSSSSSSKSSLSLPRHLVHTDALLDTLLAVYDECSGTALKHHRTASRFVAKYRSVVCEVRRLRVSIGDFTVGRTIGRGHYGRVCVVHEKRSGQVFAMKVLKKHAVLSCINNSDSATCSQMMLFEEERDIMAEATSQWLTQLHYAFQDANHLYLVMQYQAGGDLMTLLERNDGHLQENAAKFYLAEMTLALKDLHAMGYVHRDVKPDNVLLDRCGHVRLADFGSAVRVAADSGVARAHVPVGTPHYQAPETLRAMNAGTRARYGRLTATRQGAITYGCECDYWALGVVAFELMTGNTPFRGDNSTSLDRTYQNIIDFKRTLVRPGAPVLSDVAWSLITGLLTDINKRLGHSGLQTHAFFNNINWNNLANSPPPYIPKLSGADDTSHFDELCPERSRASIVDFIGGEGAASVDMATTAGSTSRRHQFSGRQLPFIGFTFSRRHVAPASCNSESAKQDDVLHSTVCLDHAGQEKQHKCPVLSISSISVNNTAMPGSEGGEQDTTSRHNWRDIDQLLSRITSQREQMMMLEERVSHYENGDVQKQVKQLNEKLGEKGSVVTKLLSERDLLESRLARAEERATGAERSLVIEKKDRMSTEKRALELIQEMKRKWERKEEERVTLLQDEIKRCSEQYASLKSTHQETVTSLQLARQQLTAAQQAEQTALSLVHQADDKHKQALDSSRLSHDELQRRLDAATDSAQRQAEQLQLQTHTHKQLAAQLRDQVQQLIDDNRLLHDKLSRQSGESGARVSRVQTECESMSRQLSDQQSTVTQLRDRLSESDSLVQQLQHRNNQLQQELRSAEERHSGALSSQLAAHQTALTGLRDSHAQHLQQLQQQMQHGEMERHKLCDQLTTERAVQVRHQERIGELEQLLHNMETSLVHLEKQSIEQQQQQQQDAEQQTRSLTSEETARLTGEVDALRHMVARLETQLESVRDRAAVDRHKVNELQLDLAKKEKQLNDWKIDVRIANREASTADKLTAELKAELAECRQQLTQRQQLQQDSADQLNQLTAEIQQLKDQLQSAEQLKQAANDKHQAELAELQQKSVDDREKLLQLSRLQTELSVSEQRIEQLEERLRDEQLASAQLRQQQETHNTATLTHNQHVDQLRQQLDHQNKAMESLKGVCTMLDKQLTDLEQVVSDKNSTIEQLRQEKVLLESSVADTESQLKTARASINEHRSLQLFADKKSASLQQRLDQLNVDRDTQAELLQRDLDEYRDMARSLTQQLTEHDEQLTESRCLVRQLQRQLEQASSECTSVKQQMSDQHTQLVSHKNSNYQLTAALETAVERAEHFKNRVQELEEQIEEMHSSQEHTDKRYNDTLAQQVKLIDFLQAKTETPAKKKTLSGRLFGGVGGVSGGGTAGGGGGGECARAGKENLAPVPLRYRELERLLESERLNNKQLSDQLTCARAEIVALNNQLRSEAVCGVSAAGISTAAVTPCLGTSPRSRQVLRVLAQSPGVQSTATSSVLTRSSATTGNSSNTTSTVSATPQQRMHHNIPHRFDTGLMSRPAKCAACLRPVRFGRQVARCHECHVVVHPKCVSELPRTCGLPPALARHFSSSWQQREHVRSASSPALAVSSSSSVHSHTPAKPPRSALLTSSTSCGHHDSDDVTCARGWIRTLSDDRCGWERRYLCVHEARLTLLSDEPTTSTDNEPITDHCTTALLNIDLSCGYVHVDPDVAHSEVPFLARRDLPYVFKVVVVPETTCWPLESHHFLCASLPDKQRWVGVLERVAAAVSDADNNTDSGGAVIRSQLVYSANSQQYIDVNCALLVAPNLMLLGCESGLFSLSLDNSRPEQRCQVPDFPAVLMMKRVPSLHQVVLIAGGDHELLVCEENAVTACAAASSVSEARLSSTRLDGLQHCHLVETGLTSDRRVFVCAASANRVCVFRWCTELVCYQLVKQFSTQEPTTCLHITNSSAIIGTDRFFEVDLANFCIEEFLDSSDASLSYVVYGTSQLRSFPVDILALRSAGARDNDCSEYLLCFHELGVFVDQYGARSRQQDVKWTRLPLAFSYHEPFVFIFHFNAVEVIQLTRRSFTTAAATAELTASTLASLAPPPLVSHIQLNAPRLLTAPVTSASGDGSCDIFLATSGAGHSASASSSAGNSQCCRLDVCRVTVHRSADDQDCDSLNTDSSLGVAGGEKTTDAGLNFSFTPSLTDSLDNQRQSSDSECVSVTVTDTQSLAAVSDSDASINNHANLTSNDDAKRVHFNRAVRVRQHTRVGSSSDTGDTKRRKI